jgi:hypothetical protein
MRGGFGSPTFRSYIYRVNEAGTQVKLKNKGYVTIRFI